MQHSPPSHHERFWKRGSFDSCTETHPATPWHPLRSCWHSIDLLSDCAQRPRESSQHALGHPSSSFCCPPSLRSSSSLFPSFRWAIPGSCPHLHRWRLAALPSGRRSRQAAHTRWSCSGWPEKVFKTSCPALLGATACRRAACFASTGNALCSAPCGQGIVASFVLCFFAIEGIHDSHAHTRSARAQCTVQVTCKSAEYKPPRTTKAVIRVGRKRLPGANPRVCGCACSQGGVILGSCSASFGVLCRRWLEGVPRRCEA